MHHHGTEALCHRGRVGAAAAAPVLQPHHHQHPVCTLLQPQAVHHSWGCSAASHSLGRSHASSVCCRVLSPEQPASTAAGPEPGAAAAAAGAATLSPTESLGSLEESSTLTNVPEDYELPPGVLSSIDRTSPAAPEDAYMCPGCTKAECKVRWGAGVMHAALLARQQLLLPASQQSRPSPCRPCCVSQAPPVSGQAKPVISCCMCTS